MKYSTLALWAFLISMNFGSYAMTPLVRNCVISRTKGPATAFCYNPKNNTFLVGYRQGDVVSYSAQTGKQQSVLFHSHNPVSIITMSQDLSLIGIGLTAVNGTSVAILKLSDQGRYHCVLRFPANSFKAVRNIIFSKDSKSFFIEYHTNEIFFFDLEGYMSFNDEAASEGSLFPRIVDSLFLGSNQFVYLPHALNSTRPSNEQLTFFIVGRDLAVYQTRRNLYTNEYGDRERFKQLEAPKYVDFKKYVPYRPYPQVFILEGMKDCKVLLFSSLYDGQKKTRSRSGFDICTFNEHEDDFKRVSQEDIPREFVRNECVANDRGWGTFPYKINNRYYLLASIINGGFKLELFDLFKLYSVQEYNIKSQLFGDYIYASSCENHFSICFQKQDNSLEVLIFNFINKKNFSEVLRGPVQKRLGRLRPKPCFKMFDVCKYDVRDIRLIRKEPLSYLEQIALEINEDDGDEESIAKFLDPHYNSDSDSSDSDSSDSDSNS